jgi:hypothetical protein
MRSVLLPLFIAGAAGFWQRPASPEEGYCARLEPSAGQRRGRTEVPNIGATAGDRKLLEARRMLEAWGPEDFARRPTGAR